MADKKDDVVKGPRHAPMVVDTSLVSDKRREELRASARKKIEAEQIKAAETQVLKELEAEERVASGLQEVQMQVEIDLAPYCDRIVIDNVIYFQGTQPIVPESRAMVMLEIMANTWKHQAEIDGKSENFYRRSRSAHVTESGVTTRSILRA